MKLEEIHIRPIQKEDNPIIARIIRDALTEFGANKPGTVYFDEATDHLFESFEAPGSGYFIASYNGKMLGGGGIYPTEGLPPQTCELVKMYLVPEARGIGLGRKLIEHSLQFAQKEGYRHVYLESMPELKQALAAYERLGFKYLNAPLGNSGHFGCDLWMLKEL